MTLGQRIYTYRTQKQLSQTALAELLEVSRQSVSKWETDASVPELDKLIKMSELFELSLDELIKGEKFEEKIASTAAKEIVSRETTANATPAPAADSTCQPPTEAPTAATKNKFFWQKIVAAVLLPCGIFSILIGTFFTRDLAIFLVALVLLAFLLLYLTTKRHGLLKCGWTLWLIIYSYLRYATGIRFWWVVMPWIYRSELRLHALIAWAQTLTLAILIFCTARIWYQKYKQEKSKL